MCVCVCVCVCVEGKHKHVMLSETLPVGVTGACFEVYMLCQGIGYRVAEIKKNGCSHLRYNYTSKHPSDDVRML